MKRCGFTLIELLIVLAIIVCIAAIAIPALLIARNASYTFDYATFANPVYYEQDGRGYLKVEVFKRQAGETLTISINLIEAKVQSGQNGDTLSTVFDGNFADDNCGYQSATIWVPSEEEKKEWDDFLNQARQREKDYQEKERKKWEEEQKRQKALDPRTPRRVPPPKI